MANLSYDEAFAKLKAWWWDDARIVKALNANGLYKDSNWWGGWSDEVDLWWPDDNSPINGVDMPDKYIPVDVDYTTKGWEEKLWEYKSESTPVNKNENPGSTSTPSDDEWSKILSGALWSSALIAGLIQKYWLKTVLWWAWKVWWFALKKVVPVAATLTAEAYALKWEHEALRNWDIWGRWWLADAWQWALYNVDKMAFDAIPDSWYYNSEENKQKAKEKQKVMDDYEKLWWSFWSNLWLAEEKWYLAEEKRIKNQYWADAVNMAEQQLTRAAVNMWLMNDADFKKELIDQWYKFWLVQDKNWNKSKAWYKPVTGSDGKTKNVLLTDAVNAVRAKWWKK